LTFRDFRSVGVGVIVASSGGVILDGVGGVVRGILGDIGQKVVVVLDVVVAMLLDGLGAVRNSFEICVVALSSFVAVGFRLCGVSAPSSFRIRGGTFLGREWQRGRRVLHPIARETRTREQANHCHLVHVAKPTLGHLPTTSAPHGLRVSTHCPPMSAVAWYLVALGTDPGCGCSWGDAERGEEGKPPASLCRWWRRSHIPERGGDVRRLIFGGWERSRRS